MGRIARLAVGIVVVAATSLVPGSTASATANGSPDTYVAFKAVNGGTEFIDVTLSCALVSTNRMVIAETIVGSGAEWSSSGFGRSWTTSNILRLDAAVEKSTLRQEVIRNPEGTPVASTLEERYPVRPGETLRVGLAVWDGDVNDCSLTPNGIVDLTPIDTDPSHAAALTVADFWGAGANAGVLDLAVAGASVEQWAERTISGYLSAVFDPGGVGGLGTSVLTITAPDGRSRTEVNKLTMSDARTGTWRFELDGTRAQVSSTNPVLWLFDLPA